MTDDVKLSDEMLMALVLAAKFAPEENRTALMLRAYELDTTPKLKGRAEQVAAFLRVVQDGLTFGRWP